MTCILLLLSLFLEQGCSQSLAVDLGATRLGGFVQDVVELGLGNLMCLEDPFGELILLYVLTEELILMLHCIDEFAAEGGVEVAEPAIQVLGERSKCFLR